MINRVVFISVLMIISLTAAAGPCLKGKVVADTSVIPTTKTQITGRPLAEKVETEKKEVDNTVKTTTVKSKTASMSKSTATTKTTSSSAAPVKKPNSTTVPAKKTTTGKTTASTKKTPAVTGTADDGSSSTAVKTTTGSTTSAKKTAATKTAANKTAGSSTATTKKATATTTAAKKTTTTATASTRKSTTSKAIADNATTTSKAATATKTKSSSKSKSRKQPKGIGVELYQPLAFKYAILLDVPVEKMIDDKLLEVLDHWYGTRYRYGGESRRGIDCSAFTQAFMLSYFDYELPRRAEEQYAKCKHIKKKKLRQGDLVFFKTKGAKGGITHVGVYLVNNRFVHSATSTGVRISHLGDDYYREHYAGAGRIK